MRFAGLALVLALLTLAASPSDASARTVRGTASHMSSAFGRHYLALPEHRWGHPGLRVRICGAGGCITRVSTDAGPDKAMQRAGRIADLSLWDFEVVCGCSAFRGLTKVSIIYLSGNAPSGVVRPNPTLPPTDMEDSSGYALDAGYEGSPARYDQWLPTDSDRSGLDVARRPILAHPR